MCVCAKEKNKVVTEGKLTLQVILKINWINDYTDPKSYGRAKTKTKGGQRLETKNKETDEK